jgi:hypothetical protein
VVAVRVGLAAFNLWFDLGAAAGRCGELDVIRRLIVVVDRGLAVDPVHYSPPNQPPSLNQPPKFVSIELGDEYRDRRGAWD